MKNESINYQNQILQTNDLIIQPTQRNLNKTQKINQSVETQDISTDKKNHIKNNHHNYRPDIDGLRAIAIILVLIFHGWPNYLTGGFIGVDVFFVISGYLITQIIRKEAKQNKFSYIQFYSRRIKRIYPALITVLVFVFLIGVSYLPQKNITIMSKTMAASTIFSANLQILTYEHDYFDPEVKTNPLLHLWSLGVEQQFYIFWPFLITVIAKFSAKKALIILGLFTLVSFLFNIYSVYQSSKFDFYFPLCRFWQMAVGGILAFINKQIKHNIVSNFMSILSLINIIYLSFTLSEESNFPGFWALIPTISSAFIILSGNNFFINKYLLNNKLFVFVGKISYPLYLWHWPLLVFSRIFYPEGSKSIFTYTILIIIISFVLSIITYYLIQNNIRFTKRKKIVLSLVFCMFIIGVGSYYASLNPQKMYQIFQKKKLIQPTNPQQFDFKDNDQQDQLQKHQQQKQQNKDKQIQNNKNNNQTQGIEHQQKFIPDEPLFQKLNINLDRNFQLLMIPGPDDYYIKNGKKIPNSSKNPKRISPNKSKVQYILKKVSQYHMSSKKGALQIIPISQNSKYYQKINWQLGPKSGRFSIINQGKQNQLFIIGDSFAQNIGWRFRKLYQQSSQNNNLDKFPTIVYIIQRGMPYFHCAPLFNFSIQYVKKHKPQRIFLAYHWLHQLAYNSKLQPSQIHDMSTQCSSSSEAPYFGRRKSDAQQDLNIAAKVLKQFVDLGIEVYTTGLHPLDGNLNPQKMADFNQIIESNVQPIKLSKFKQKYKNIIQMFQNSMRQAGVKIVDYSQNHCWNDLCQVAVPTGYPIFIDHSHYSIPYSLHWVSAVDFLTQF